MSEDKDQLVHWNKDTQGTGPFHRRDKVVLKNPRRDRILVDWYNKRVGHVGEVSAVFDKDEVCSVLFEDGYWLDLHFDEIEATGESGNGFPEIHYVPLDIWK